MSIDALIDEVRRRRTPAEPLHVISWLLDTSVLHRNSQVCCRSQVGWANRLAPARRTARASKTVTPAACPSPVRRRQPLPRVSSCTVHWLSSSCERANFISTKEETRWLPTTNPRTRCDAATSKRRSGRMSARRVRSSQRPSPAHSRISQGCGAMGPPSVSMTLRPLSMSRVRPRSGLPLMH